MTTSRPGRFKMAKRASRIEIEKPRYRSKNFEVALTSSLGKLM